MSQDRAGITTPFIKLDSLLKLTDLTMSGGEAKKAVQSGQVRVNGEVCTERGRKIYPGDSVNFMGKTITVEAKC